MTIKQQGGVFGRNPTFNDVAAETLSVSGDVNAGSGTLRVDASTGYVGVNINPAIDLHVYNAAGAWARVEAGAANAFLNLKNSAKNYYIYNNNATGKLVFFDATAGLERMSIGSSGNLAFPSGQGIDFSATSGTGTSELFDDYEEGTFTPAAARAVNFVVNAANYTKIGRLVSCEMNVQWDSTDNSSGNLTITGLPFTSTAGTGYLTVGSALINGTDVNTDIAGAVVARLAGTKTEIVLAKATAAALNIVQANECNSATELTIQLNYTTAS